MQKITSQNQNARRNVGEGYTIGPMYVPAVLAHQPSPELLRLPANGTRDFIYGQSRSTWNALILPCKANNFRPPIKSISIRRPGAIRGIRAILASSAREYFQRLIAEADESLGVKEKADEMVPSKRRRTKAQPKSSRP